MVGYSSNQALVFGFSKFIADYIRTKSGQIIPKPEIQENLVEFSFQNIKFKLEFLVESKVCLTIAFPSGEQKTLQDKILFEENKPEYKVFESFYERVIKPELREYFRSLKTTQ